MALLQADTVVVGGGLAGIVTALELLRAGQRVVLIDRDTPKRLGGLALWAFGGMALVGTPLQQAMGIPDTPERALLDWMQANNEAMTACIVGEPTCPETMGEMIKVGRRGSLTAHFTVTGEQGHSAYPHRANNPLPAMARLMDRLSSHELDQGTDHFDPSTLAVVTIDGQATVFVAPPGGGAGDSAAAASGAPDDSGPDAVPVTLVGHFEGDPIVRSERLRPGDRVVARGAFLPRDRGREARPPACRARFRQVAVNGLTRSCAWGAGGSGTGRGDTSPTEGALP